MKTLILLAAIMAVSATAYAQQTYTCSDVKKHPCSVLRFHAWWNNVSKSDQRRIALKCGVSYCLR